MQSGLYISIRQYLKIIIIINNSHINLSFLDGKRGLHYSIPRLSKPFIKAAEVRGKSPVVFATSEPVTTVSFLQVIDFYLKQIPGTISMLLKLLH